MRVDSNRVTTAFRDLLIIATVLFYTMSTSHMSFLGANVVESGATLNNRSLELAGDHLL
jgi:hypothetical protein